MQELHDFYQKWFLSLIKSDEKYHSFLNIIPEDILVLIINNFFRYHYYSRILLVWDEYIIQESEVECLKNENYRLLVIDNLLLEDSFNDLLNFLEIKYNYYIKQQITWFSFKTLVVVLIIIIIGVILIYLSLL